MKNKVMNDKQMIIAVFILLVSYTGFSQVTSYNLDPNKVNKKLAAQVDSLYQEDQQYRLELGKLRKANAPKIAIDSLTAIIKAKDSSNLVFVEKWLNQYGWLSPQEIGFQGVQAIFLVIQHADLNTQKKYYPLIKKAETEGNILSSNVAILEDRIAVREGRAQPYGSQFFFDKERNKNVVYPVTDIENLDTSRKSMGLQPMSEYLKDWSIETYKINLAYAQEQLTKRSIQGK